MLTQVTHRSFPPCNSCKLPVKKEKKERKQLTGDTEARDRLIELPDGEKTDQQLQQIALCHQDKMPCNFIPACVYNNLIL